VSIFTFKQQYGTLFVQVWTSVGANAKNTPNGSALEQVRQTAELGISMQNLLAAASSAKVSLEPSVSCRQCPSFKRILL
jgi:hypothetical protein